MLRTLLQIRPSLVGSWILLTLGLNSCCDLVQDDIPKSAFKDENVRLFYEEHIAKVLRKGKEHKVVLIAFWPDTTRLSGSSAPCYQTLQPSYRVADRGILIQFEDSAALSKFFIFSKMKHPVDDKELSNWTECPPIPWHFEPVFSEIFFKTVGYKD